MMKYRIEKNELYRVKAPAVCVVRDSAGVELGTAEPGRDFVLSSAAPWVDLSEDGARLYHGRTGALVPAGGHALGKVRMVEDVFTCEHDGVIICPAGQDSPGALRSVVYTLGGRGLVGGLCLHFLRGQNKVVSVKAWRDGSLLPVSFSRDEFGADCCALHVAFVEPFAAYDGARVKIEFEYEAGAGESSDAFLLAGVADGVPSVEGARGVYCVAGESELVNGGRVPVGVRAELFYRKTLADVLRELRA